MVACAARGDQDQGTIVGSQIGNWRPQHLLTAAFCLLGFIIILLEFILFLRAKDRVSANDIMRTFSTTLILISVVALIGIGYDAAQVQPAIALFGTLLGYLMGRGEAFRPPSPNSGQARDRKSPPEE